MEIDELGNELVSCNLNCAGINVKPKEGIIPRGLIFEERDGKNQSIVVVLNPGKCKQVEKEFYKVHDLSYQSIKDYYHSKLKNISYFQKTRDLISYLGYDGDILWTNLVKCECSGINGDLPVQTLRVCIKKYLCEEIKKFDANIIFALGNDAFNFCALCFPNHFVVGIPHPTGSYGKSGFKEIETKIKNDRNYYIKKLSTQKDNNGNSVAIHISKI